MLRFITGVTPIWQSAETILRNKKNHNFFLHSKIIGLNRLSAT